MAEHPFADRSMQPLRTDLPPGIAGNSSTPAGDEVHLLDYLRVFYKRRWTALTTFLVIVLCVAVYTFTATPMYEARAEVLIQGQTPDIVSFKGVTDDEDKTTPDYYQTQYKILESRALARRTIDRLKLWDSPLFAPKKGIRAALNAVTGLFSRHAGEPRSPDETVEQARVIDAFLAGLTIAPVRNSQLVDIQYRSVQAATAAAIANTLAQQYIEQNLEFRTSSSKQAESFLQGQIEAQRKQVEASEKALQKYREKNNALSLEDRQNIVVQKLSDLNTALTAAKTNRLQKENLYDQIVQLQKSGQPLDSFPAILANDYIQQEKAQLGTLEQQKAQMAEKLGPRHPDMIKINAAIESEKAKLQGEIEKVVMATKNDYLAAQAQENSLAQALEQQKTDAMDLSKKGIDYGVLQRDAQTNRQIFESLLERAKQTGISGQVTATGIRIVDRAEVPRSPSYPRKMMNLGMAGFGGLVFAVGLVFFFEYMDNRIKTPDELKAHLGVPYLGMVPALFGKEIESPLINNGVPAHFSEAFRGIRTSVLFSSVDEGGKAIAITSTGPGEGKTIVASNLAIALAQSGQRVLLIDADMRRPRVCTVFGMTQTPGLSNVLVGDAQPSQAVQRSSVPGLWILPSGQVPPNPAELLGTRRFKDFLATLNQHFDWTIVDTPPVMAVTDAALVAHIASGVIYVVGADMTSRQNAQRAMEQLDGASAKFLGAILNKVDLQHNGYYYSQYYRPEYAQYYQSLTKQ
jgi:capsular exopolysaccharide synthesis family protein